MIKIQPIVREIVLREYEAYYALTHDFMNMSSYAYKIKPEVEELTKKKVTITSLVVSLSRIKKELKKAKPLIHNVKITHVTTKLPLTEIIYENNEQFIKDLETLHKAIGVSREDFFSSTIGATELDIICSESLEAKILRHFNQKPRILNRNLAGVGVSYGEEVFGTPNVFFSLLSATSRAGINIEELVSTPTELTFIVHERDFGRTVAIFSELHRQVHK